MSAVPGRNATTVDYTLDDGRKTYALMTAVNEEAKTANIVYIDPDDGTWHFAEAVPADRLS